MSLRFAQRDTVKQELAVVRKNYRKTFIMDMYTAQMGRDERSAQQREEAAVAVAAAAAAVAAIGKSRGGKGRKPPGTLAKRGDPTGEISG